MAGSQDASFEKGYGAGQQVEDANSVRPRQRTFARKLGAHFKKWWWVHLIIFLAITLILTLCLIYVAFPHIAQSGVNDASLTIDSIMYLSPGPETITLAQNATLHSGNMYTPTLDPFNASLWLITAGRWATAPLLDATLPRIHATDNRIIAFDEPLPIANLDQVTAYSIAVLTQETVTSGITGRPRLHLGKLPVNTVKFNQTVTYKGLNGLKGFNTTDVRINITQTTGQNLKGTAFIPNPSTLTMEIGNVTLGLSIGSVSVGTAQIDDMTIRPGDNNFPMTGSLNQTAVLANYDSTTGIANMTITGGDVIFDGQHISYYEAAFKANVLHLPLNVTQIIRDSLGVA